MSSTLEARSKYFNELTVAYFLTLTQEESAGPAGILVYSSSFRSCTVLEDIMVFNFLYTSHRRAQCGVWVVAVHCTGRGQGWQADLRQTCPPPADMT